MPHKGSIVRLPSGHSLDLEGASGHSGVLTPSPNKRRSPLRSKGNESSDAGGLTSDDDHGMSPPPVEPTLAPSPKKATDNDDGGDDEGEGDAQRSTEHVPSTPPGKRTMFASVRFRHRSSGTALCSPSEKAQAVAQRHHHRRGVSPSSASPPKEPEVHLASRGSDPLAATVQAAAEVEGVDIGSGDGGDVFGPLTGDNMLGRGDTPEPG
jgi:hypothetical protein